MSHNFKMPQTTHAQLILVAAHDLAKLLQTKTTDSIITPITADTREQLKLLNNIFSRKQNQDNITEGEPRVPLLKKHKIIQHPIDKRKYYFYHGWGTSQNQGTINQSDK